MVLNRSSPPPQKKNKAVWIFDYDNIGFIFWSIEALNRDGQWEIVGYATTAVVGGDVVKYIETVGFATVRYNDENPWAILETFDAV